MKKLFTAVLFFIATSAFAQQDPVAQLQEAMANYPKSGNQFAGYSLSCLNVFVVGKSGVYAPSSQRQCLSGMLTKSMADQIVSELKWVNVYSSTDMDMVKVVPTSSTGDVYMLVHYDKSGNASELTLFNGRM